MLAMGTMTALLVAGPSTAAAPPTKAQLEVEKLRQEVRQLQIQNDRAGSLRETILDWAPFVTVLIAVAGVILPIRKEARAQRNQRKLELEQRQVEERRRFDDLFAQAVGNLGADNEAVRVSGAVTLDNFLRDGYEPFHEQVYSVLRANLAVDHTKLVNRFILRAFERAIRLHLAAVEREEEAAGPVDLARCRLYRVDLHGLNLDEADLAFATLKEANLRGSSLVRARGIDVDLEKAKLSGALLTEVRFNGAACKGAHFHNTRLVSAEFRETQTRNADLRSAEFYGARLQGAHFDRADFSGATFDNANLSDTFFPGARFDEAALRSLLKSEVVNGVPSWQKAHFDADVRAALSELQGRPGARKRASAPAAGP
jgi:uncharacterized protein YjbI with pentapeptide repeats